MGQFGIGQPVRRKEDTRLLTGRGQFTDDLNFEGQAWAAFVRSPHANARILGVDVSAALEMPGVVAVFTGEDVAEAGLGKLVNDAAYKDRDGQPHAQDAARDHAGRSTRASWAKFSPWSWLKAITPRVKPPRR